MKRLAIITTHPIQYYAPVFTLLQQRQKIQIMVFYTLGQHAVQLGHDPGFERTINWDIPLTEGYPYTWVNNTAKKPGSHHFSGVKTPDLIECVAAWQPDALLVFGWSYRGHLGVIRYFKNKVPVIFRGDSTLLDQTGAARSLLKYLLLKWVYRHVDAALYVGSNNKAYFKHYGLKDDQLVFAPHAVDNERFATKKTNSRDIRSELGIPADSVLVLFAGKLSTKKAPLLLLDGFMAIADPNVHLLFAGNGELEAELKLKADGQSHVHFLDFTNQSEMPAVYQACDVFCLPSTGPGETWGLAVNEAMACGKAVLVSDRVGCAKDLVSAKVNGLVFESGNVTDLAEKLHFLTKDRNICVSYGKESVALIKDWNFNAIATAIEKTLINITNGRTK
ncbi:glycosyltransferase family 4 protein [Mucilaginibacter sp. HD30]